MKRTTFTTLALPLLLTALVACGGKDASKNEGTNWITGTDTSSTLAEATHPASPGGAALVPDATAGVTAQIMLEEGRITPPAMPLPPGPVVFTVTNMGKDTHSLHIEGPGVSKAADQPLNTGTTQSITVTLQKGTYTLYCPLFDHRERGESITLTTGTDPATSTAVPTGTAPDTASPTPTATSAPTQS